MRFDVQAVRRLRLALAAALALALSLIFVTSDARAGTGIDPCGNGGASTTAVSPSLGFQTGSGPAALQCGPKQTYFPDVIPEDVPIKAPDAGQVDPSFKTGFPYMIGPDGAEVSYTAITASQLLKTFLESLGSSLTEDAIAGNLFPPESEAAAAAEAVSDALVAVLKAVISDLISEEEALQGADWDWTVPANTGTGNWFEWFSWLGTGGALGVNPTGQPAITPSSVNPALENWYTYNPTDDYYQDRPPAPYARVFMGATRVTLKQGPGITKTAEALTNQGTCGQPSCFGASASRKARASAAAHRKRGAAGFPGKAIKQTSAAQRKLTGTAGNDEVRATMGVRKVRVGAGHDQVLAGRGGNRLYGGTGNDELTSFAGPDTLKGGTGHDMLQGGSGSDVSIGNAGSDSLFDVKGKDRMFGGTGPDRIVVRDKKGDDRVNCGPGRDMVIADPRDRIVLKSGDTVPAGSFTAHHKPANSTCELVFSSVHMPPRNPPHIGHHAGRPRGAPEPSWPVLD